MRSRLASLPVVQAAVDEVARVLPKAEVSYSDDGQHIVFIDHTEPEATFIVTVDLDYDTMLPVTRGIGTDDSAWIDGAPVRLEVL